MHQKDGVTDKHGELLEVLRDAIAREILEETQDTPKSVEQISDECMVSQQSVERRVDVMSEMDLLRKAGTNGSTRYVNDAESHTYTIDDLQEHRTH